MEKGAVILADNFMLIAKAMVASSSDMLRVAYREKDKSSSLDEETGHFLKLENKRIGQDIEIYISMSKNFNFYGLPDFFLILTKIKYSCPESYKIGAEMLEKVGNTIFEGEILKNWNLLFKPIE